MEEWIYSSISALDEGEIGQLHAPRALLTGKNPQYFFMRG
jgi:hypothetical protein